MSKRIVICNPHHERICSSTTYWFLDLFDALWCGDNAGIEQAKLDSSIRIDNGVKSQLTFTICCCYERDSFFLRIARGGLPIPNKENWHSSFGQRPRRDELFFNIFWTFSGVPVGCSSSGKSALALYSIDNLVGSLEDWEDLLSPHFYIYKKWLKKCTNKCCLCHSTFSCSTTKKYRAIKNSPRNSPWKIPVSYLHYISLIQNVKYLSFWQLSYFAWVRHMYQIVCMNLEGLLQS